MTLPTPIPPTHSPDAERPRGALLRALFLLLAVALGANLAFDAWHRSLPPSKRNPHFRRAWVEHVEREPARRTNEFLLVLISHSQGWGREVTDAETYAVRLEAYLGARMTQTVRVVNWSIDGADAPEYVMLAAAARRLRPDVVLLVSGDDNYGAHYLGKHPTNRRRTPWASDIHYLLEDPEIRRSLPIGYRQHFFDIRDVVDVGLASLWRGWRYREIPLARLFQVKALQPFAGGQKEPIWFIRPPANPRHIQPPRRPQPLNWLGASWYFKTLRGLPARCIVVGMPMHSSWRKSTGEFPAEMKRRAELEGHLWWDLADAIPDGEFYTAAHLAPAGHDRFARILAERLAP